MKSPFKSPLIINHGFVWIFLFSISNNLFAAPAVDHKLKKDSADDSNAESSSSSQGKNTKAASRFARTLVYSLGCEDFPMLVPYVVYDLKMALASGVNRTDLENIVYDYSDDRTRNHYNSTYEFITTRVLDIAKFVENDFAIDVNDQAFRDKIKAVGQEARSRGFSCQLSNSTRAKLYSAPSPTVPSSVADITQNASSETDPAAAVLPAPARIPPPPIPSASAKPVSKPDQINIDSTINGNHQILPLKPDPMSLGISMGHDFQPATQLAYAPSPIGVPVYKVTTYDKKIVDFDVEKFESVSCKDNVHKTTRKMLYEEFVRELFAVKRKANAKDLSNSILKNYVRMSFVACTESNGQPYVVSTHRQEGSISFPSTSKEFKDEAKRSTTIGEKFSNLGTAIANFVAGRSVFSTLNDLRKYYGNTPGYSDRISVFDHQTNFGVYQISADRMYLEPTKSYLKERLRDIATSNRALEYCQMSSFYPRTNKEQFTERFAMASNAMITALNSKDPYGDWKSVDSNRDGRVDQIKTKNSSGKTVYIPDPKKLAKLQTLRSSIWAFADMMAMCPRLNMDLGKITMEQFGSKYFGPLRSSQLSNSKTRCADGNELLRKGRVKVSQLGTQTCSQAFVELKRRVEAGLIAENDLNTKGLVAVSDTLSKPIAAVRPVVDANAEAPTFLPAPAELGVKPVDTLSPERAPASPDFSNVIGEQPIAQIALDPMLPVPDPSISDPSRPGFLGGPIQDGMPEGGDAPMPPPE